MQKTQREHKRESPTHGVQSESQIVDFKLERYRFILEEIRMLNENIHKYLTLFQTLATAIIGGGIWILFTWKSLHMDFNAAKIAIQGAVGLLILLDLFVTISVIAIVLSWFDYRKEEVELVKEIAGPDFRKPPTLRNFWRWSETYVLLFINLSVIAVVLYVEYWIIPLIK